MMLEQRVEAAKRRVVVAMAMQMALVRVMTTARLLAGAMAADARSTRTPGKCGHPGRRRTPTRRAAARASSAGAATFFCAS